MALQGDLNSFALPEVLRLLAGTAKSGRLEVTGDGASGTLTLVEGSVADAGITSTPQADQPADVLYEMLRFDQGSFSFVEGDVSPNGEGHDVESVIAAAESLVAEWSEVETVVPSMAAWITLATELPTDESVKLSPDRWRLVATIAGGATAADVARALALGDLAACKELKNLADGGLVEVRASHLYDAPSDDRPMPVHLDDFSSFEDDEVAEHPMTELEDLVVEDRPVVMTDRDDALLPEPLPGEGVTYEGEEIVGIVDGFRSEPEPDLEPERSEPEFEPEAATAADPFAALAAATAEYPQHATSDAEAYEAELDDAEPDEVEHDPLAGSALAAAITSEVANDAAGSDGEGDDEERGSLLRFLSTVKP